MKRFVVNILLFFTIICVFIGAGIFSATCQDALYVRIVLEK